MLLLLLPDFIAAPEQPSRRRKLGSGLFFSHAFRRYFPQRKGEKEKPGGEEMHFLLPLLASSSFGGGKEREFLLLEKKLLWRPGGNSSILNRERRDVSPRFLKLLPVFSWGKGAVVVQKIGDNTTLICRCRRRKQDGFFVLGRSRERDKWSCFHSGNFPEKGKEKQRSWFFFYCVCVCIPR